MTKLQQILLRLPAAFAHILMLFLVLGQCLSMVGCTRKRGRDQSAAISQRLEEQKTQTDELRAAMRYLRQLTPLTRDVVAHEVRLQLNTWMQKVDVSRANYKPPALLEQLPPDMLEPVGCRTPLELTFSYWDVDYLYQCYMMRSLAEWVVASPLRDSLLARMLEKSVQPLSAEEALKLEEACKLFEWTTRNISLDEAGSSVEDLVADPQPPIQDGQPGYRNLPWESLLYSYADAIERGRVFTALCQQRRIDTLWIAVRAESPPARIWCVGVLAGGNLWLFEPRLAMPVVDPDRLVLATLKDAQENPRILRRLDVPGRFDYGLDPGDIGDIELLVDVPPTAASARMKILEEALIGRERMVLFLDLERIKQVAQAAHPKARVRLWQVPLMAQLQAASVRDRLRRMSDFTLNYFAKHGVWMIDNPAARGRLKHLFGQFENTMDERGALSLYMDSRIDDERIRKLEYDPEVQRELGFTRRSGEELEQFRARLRQAQAVLRQAKVDAAFLMAQLHFDRGNYEAAKNWFVKRVIGSPDPRAQKWHAISHYALARVYQELAQYDDAEQHLTWQPSSQEAGNRLRLRYLRAVFETDSAHDARQPDQDDGGASDDVPTGSPQLDAPGD